MKSKICLGIDPGLSNTGWAVVSRNRSGAFEMMDCGCIITHKKDTEPKRVLQIYNAIHEVLATHQPDCLATDRVCLLRVYPTSVNSLQNKQISRA